MTERWQQPESEPTTDSPSGDWSVDEALFEASDEDENYEPGLFSRLTANRPLVILLVIAFLLLILAPWLYYLLNPPHPRPPRQAPGKTILVQRDGALPSGVLGVADAKPGTQYPCD